MALTDSIDTLAYHQSRVFTQPRSMVHVSTADVAKRCAAFMSLDHEKDTAPECEALWFYGMNHGVALINAEYAPHQPLSKSDQAFIELYHKVLGPKAVRAFYYLLLICTRETRHVHAWKDFDNKLAKNFGKNCLAFNVSIRGTGSTVAYQKLLSGPPAASIAAYTKSLSWIFYNGHFAGGYGGQKWGKVADCLVRFVTGEFTAEMMLDTVWTLCHNGGPIFNKGMLYDHYGDSLIRLLDIQRSGQIPAAIYDDDPELMGYVDQKLDAQMTWLMSRFGDKLGKYVDWYVVEALGAQNKYPNEKKAQAQKHGMSEKASQAEKAAAAVVKAKEDAGLAKKLAYAQKYFQVMPGLEVEKIERPLKAA